MLEDPYHELYHDLYPVDAFVLVLADESRYGPPLYAFRSPMHQVLVALHPILHPISYAFDRKLKGGNYLVLPPR